MRRQGRTRGRSSCRISGTAYSPDTPPAGQRTGRCQHKQYIRQDPHHKSQATGGLLVFLPHHHGARRRRRSRGLGWTWRRRGGRRWRSPAKTSNLSESAHESQATAACLCIYGVGGGGVGVGGAGPGGVACVKPVMQSGETTIVVAAEWRVQMPPVVTPAVALNVKLVQVGKVAHSVTRQGEQKVSKREQNVSKQ